MTGFATAPPTEPSLFELARVGEPVTLRRPDAVRPWQHVLDPLAGYLTLAERLHGSPEWAAPWNFGPDESRSVSWVVERVRESWQLDVRIADPGDGVEAPELRLDASAAREHLQWRLQMDVGAALAATVSWYDEVRAGADARTVTLTQIEELT